MPKAKFLTVILFALVFLFLVEPHLAAQGPVSPSAQAEFIPGEIVVKFKPGIKRQDVRQRLAEVQGNVIHSIPAIEALQVKVPEGRELEMIAKLSARADVAYVEPNYIVHALDIIPDDPNYVSQWNLAKINLPAAWEISQGDSDVIVAIIDTGIDLDHPDFSCTVPGGAPKLTAGYNFISDNNNPNDDHYHGTHVAGIAGACTNNATGVAGVAPHVRLMPVKVLNSAGSGTFTGVANGIIYAANNGAKVLNLSLGSPSPSDLVRDAVNYAYSQGTLVVAASGNAGTSPVYYPAAYSNAMAVGSTTSIDARSSFSSYGAALDIMAPGSSIYSTMIGSYGFLSGTSMATPHVSGLAALVWSVAPDLTHDEVRQVIQNTAEDLGTAGWDQYFGYGRIDAFRALEPFAVHLQETTGLNLAEPVTFLVDVGNSPIPTFKTIQVATDNSDPISWTAVISPSVSWVEIVLPNSGDVSAASPGSLTLEASEPLEPLGTYTTTLVVTGTTSLGADVGKTTAQIKIVYVQQLFRYRLPVIFKQ